MRLAAGVALSIFSACAALCQPAATAPAFEVASVKAAAPGSGGRGEGMGGGGREVVTPSPAGVTMRNVRLKSIIQWAYHLQALQVTGPGWLDDNRYDVVAKTAGETSREQERLMMQTLLADRFKLTAHRDTKELPAYVFTVGKNGHKLKPSETEGEMEIKPNGSNQMKASFSKVSMAQIIDVLSNPLPGIIVDQTGLKGSYDFSLDMSQVVGGGEFKPQGVDDMINLIIQVAKDQLGIVIEQKKVPSDVFIVEHAEKVPVEN